MGEAAMSTTKKTDRCWPGYEPVPGKPEHSQGSCCKKPPSKQTPSEAKFVKKREKQLENWQKSHPKSPRKSAQHKSAPGSKRTARKSR